MSTLIKGGTIVTADRTYKADVLIEGESISAIGSGLSGTTTIDATGCFIMPGGTDCSMDYDPITDRFYWTDGLSGRIYYIVPRKLNRLAPPANLQQSTRLWVKIVACHVAVEAPAPRSGQP